MEGRIKSETIKGEKSGFGRVWPSAGGSPFFFFKSLGYEKIMVARTLFVILLGLLGLIFFGHQR